MKWFFLAVNLVVALLQSVIVVCQDCPAHIGSYDLPYSHRGWDVEVVDGMAYVAHFDTGYNEGGLRVLDVSNPYGPTPVGTWITPELGTRSEDLNWVPGQRILGCSAVAAVPDRVDFPQLPRIL